MIYTHAVVVFFHGDGLWRKSNLGFATDCVVPFPSEEAALDWAIAKLIQHKEIVAHFDELYSHDRTLRFSSRDEALEHFQKTSLEATEYFHIKPIQPEEQ